MIDDSISNMEMLNLNDGERVILVHGIGTLVTTVEGVHNGKNHTTIPAADYIAELNAKIDLLEYALKQIRTISSYNIS